MLDFFVRARSLNAASPWTIFPNRERVPILSERNSFPRVSNEWWRRGWDGIEGFSISFIDTLRSDKNAYRGIEVVCTAVCRLYDRKIGRVTSFYFFYDLDTISFFFYLWCKYIWRRWRRNWVIERILRSVKNRRRRYKATKIPARLESKLANRPVGPKAQAHTETLNQASFSFPLSSLCLDTRTRPGPLIVIATILEWYYRTLEIRRNFENS